MSTEELALELTKAIITHEDVSGNSNKKAKEVVGLYMAIIKELNSNQSK